MYSFDWIESHRQANDDIDEMNPFFAFYLRNPLISNVKIGINVDLRIQTIITF